MAGPAPKDRGRPPPERIMDMLDKIYAQVEAVNNKLTTVLTNQAAMAEQVKNQANMIHGLRSTVYGNPTPKTGLVARLATLERCKRTLNDDRQQLRTFWLGVLQKLVTWAFIALLCFGLWLYKNHGEKDHARNSNSDVVVTK